MGSSCSPAPRLLRCNAQDRTTAPPLFFTQPAGMELCLQTVNVSQHVYSAFQSLNSTICLHVSSEVYLLLCILVFGRWAKRYGLETLDELVFASTP
jgi:hypothetical protein